MREKSMELKLLILFLLLVAAMEAAISEAKSLKGCLKKCGEVEIPYPFGVGDNCSLEKPFNLTCDTSTSTLFYGKNPVSSISVQHGLMDVLFEVSKICGNQSEEKHPRLLDAGHYFTISTSENMFVSVGCNILGRICSHHEGQSTNFGGCLAICDQLPKNNNTCAGTGCCHGEIPPQGKPSTYDFQATRAFSNYKVSNGNNCSYAFVAKNGWFSFSPHHLLNFPFEVTPVVLDWTVSNVSCQNGSSPYCACKNNTYHVDYYSNAGHRYKCKCKPGFEGNPYYLDGCQDVDECTRPNNCSMPKRCHNLEGGYHCSCPPAHKGDGKANGSGCTLDYGFIALSCSASLLIVFILVYTSCWTYKQRTLKQVRRRNFEQNGGNMLQQQISQQQAYSGKTKLFTEAELKNATNNFHKDTILGHGGQGIVYKGILSDKTPIAIKKPRQGGDPQQIKDFINEVCVLSQINHRNVVKLLGCCLETEVPLLVYEFVNNGTLLDHIDPLKNDGSIMWETRLRIAAEIAGAIAYLHSYASIPIIHRDIKSANILLDHNLRAKVSDFGSSRLIPLDATHVTTIVQGTLGYLDPEYLHIGELNEKSDVYSFGVVLVELLTGRKAIKFSRPEQRNLAMYFVSSMKENHLWEILDKRVLEQKNAKQLKEVASLARRCLRVKGEERPTMREVAMDLEGLISMGKHTWGKDKGIVAEESEYLLGHVPEGYDDASSSIIVSVTSYDGIQSQSSPEIIGGR
ncbi:wall-associated receptor kinase 3-like [Neltuma alba]|uniref:wall-associated receptor kinase 3-like n=1 Tax=Neltuma alba TaxID=207710 RepID=UPI0010A3BF39|nr:wall-associated receptor kinase 3-like [Prosopis alba]